MLDSHDFLLDTHVLIWLNTDIELVSKKVQRIFKGRKNRLFFSMVSLWEMAIKMGLKKLSLDVSFQEFIAKGIVQNNIGLLPIKTEHFLALLGLPMHHRDPFDRLIIAQAQVENLQVISRDAHFKLYQIDVVY